MKAGDAVIAQLDAQVDGIDTDAVTSDELFAVVDLLDANVMLRRSLSDPSAAESSRVELASRIFRGKVAPATLEVLSAFSAAEFESGAAFVEALEREGVRLKLKAARSDGTLDTVTSDLFQALSVVRDHPELAVALRNPSYGAAEKRELLERLFVGRISPVAQALLDRAVRPNLAAFVPTVGGFLRAAAELAGLTIARVTVARPLDESRTARLKAALEKSVGKPLSLQVHVDPSVIGGVNVAIGYDVIESTVAARLEDARRQLVNL